MSVLALRLAGPLQSWGASARFTRRTTESAPTKSGVIGMLAAALGLERGDDAGLAPLAALRFGVRIDQPGTRLRDFHTAHHADTGKSMPLSERFYLADAVFVAAVEGDRTLVERLHTALRDPVHPPYLGRRSCPPALPVELGVHHGAGLAEVLETVPWQAAPWYRRARRRDAEVGLVLLRDAAAAENIGNTLRDQPISFAAEHRLHALRPVVGSTVAVTNPLAVPALARTSASDAPVPPHDPFAVLAEEEEDA